MAVLVNFKICDNDKACSGMAVCPKRCFSWGEKGLIIDNEKCISCGKCEEACMVSAIKVARNEEEYQKIKKEIEEDPRTINDLLVDRYGAKSIDIAMVGREEEIETKLEAKRPMIYEKYYIPEQLQLHMLRVAACSKLITDNWEGKEIDKEAIYQYGNWKRGRTY